MAKTTDMVFAIYGHDKTASKALKGVGKESESVSKQFAKMGKVAAASFAVAGAAAAKFAYDSVKAAADDQKSQKQLALALQNTTKATQAQVKQSEDFITKLQMSYGIADDKLRPALATLARGTNNLTESQNLLGLAMDISAGTGKDLGAVSFALAKAHNGNVGALKRLGIPLADNIVKTKDFNAATKVLAQTFGGAAKTSAETFSGRLAIMQEHFKESKEQIGYALMPVLTTFADYLVTNVVPNVQGFVDGLTGVKNSGDKATESAYNFGEQVRSVIDFIVKNQKTVENFAKIIGSIFIASKVYAGVSAITTGLALMRGAFVKTTATAAVAAEAEAAATGGLSLAAALPAMAALAAFFGTALFSLGTSTGHKASISKGQGPSKSYAEITGGSTKAPFGMPYGSDTGGKFGSHFRRSNITPSSLDTGSGMNVVVNVHGSVVHEKDLAVSVRDNIAQLMRRRGLNPSILGV